jgi:hypothetical protein
MAQRIVMTDNEDEGRRDQVEISGGRVTNAWNTTTLFRGYEIILEGATPGTPGTSPTGYAGYARHLTATPPHVPRGLLRVKPRTTRGDRNLFRPRMATTTYSGSTY